MDSQWNKQPLTKNRRLRIAGWKVSGNPYKCKEFQAMESNLSHSLEEKVHSQIKSHPGISGLVGVIKNKLILFVPLWTKFWIICQIFLIMVTNTKLEITAA